MKTKIIKTVIPSILGILAVQIILAVFNIIVHGGDAFSKPDNGFFTLFVPITTLIAIIIQFTLTLPFWKRFQSRKKVWGLTLIPFTIILCIISGLLFGLLFWERDNGFSEFIAVSLTGIIAFSIYWAVNILTLKQIDRSSDRASEG